MADYLIQISYTPEALARLIANPQNREEVARSLIEKLGGELKGFWFSFGDYDLVELATLPDNVSAAALSMAVFGGGAVKAFKTTPLLSLNEGIDAMKKASELGYQPPMNN
ncbi:MAG: GYD domain-containing protein [Methanosarcinaceae archaeon]|nr:GYD domain-containing protein [Methanosarcinaceae archaeon]